VMRRIGGAPRDVNQHTTGRGHQVRSGISGHRAGV
jgi:hypothetical protein